ncbi:hypothetical protein H6P81_009274 [Aristolochia fimbriata]|uniref:Uncharacterized protein n=1 Tax=Aristolochia fimbriata TaxID=158543 RepID=A0AAV7EKQ3_ARIFI|nr:hypothetical protein H6P81_009274 [Aristolochia fimbriata]
MASYLSVKSKRKDFEEVYDDFSDFSLSSPARKIRRLDAELPPIMEEEEPMIPPVFDQHIPEEQPRAPVVIEELPPAPLNEERALVLYKPMAAPFLQSPTTSGLSFKVHTQLIPGFNDQMFWSGPSELIRNAENEERERSNNCMAVVPWTPSSIPTGEAMGVSAPGNNLSEVMEAETAEATSMEVEDESNSFFSQGETGGSAADAVMVADRSESPQQQWPQHCMTAQLSRNSSTPVMWSW